MKKSRFTETQIVSILKQADSGITVAEVCRKNSISANTFYEWMKKYAGLGVSELKRLKELEAENLKNVRRYGFRTRRFKGFNRKNAR